ncbi:MAG: flagellar biosynthesis protein FlhB [Myxococcales bacterium]|nr:flagellar biosynthesis protein FlhB [Myxococcales bacterium]
MADEEKTEAATPRKLEKAREKGDVPQSQDVPILLLLIVAFIALVSPLGENIAVMWAQLARDAWGGRLILPDTVGDLTVLIQYSASEIARVLLPFGLLFVLISCVSLWAQVGFLFTTEKLRFKLTNLNVAKGLKRLFGLDRFYKLLKSIVKLSVYSVIVYSLVAPDFEQIMSLLDAGVIATLLHAGDLLKRVMIYILLVSVIFAAIDLMWVRYRYTKKMKMTKQEVRDEIKQRQGDPKVRAQIRKKQLAMAGSRMLEAVSKADVVVTNPTHYAVAIQYRPPEITTPRVVAKGRNKLALKIKEEARRSGVPIVENPPTAQLLYKLVAVDQEIPENLYKAVAELLAYIFRLDPGSRRGWKQAS